MTRIEKDRIDRKYEDVIDDLRVELDILFASMPLDSDVRQLQAMTRMLRDVKILEERLEVDGVIIGNDWAGA